MSYKKSADSNRDALFGGPKHKKEAATNRDALFVGNVEKKSSRSGSKTQQSSASTGSANRPDAVQPSNQGYARKKEALKKKKPSLTGPAHETKLNEAKEYRDKANKCMQKSFFSNPDPVAASTFFKRAADCYQLCGDEKLERLFRLESAACNMQVGAWASAAGDYARAAELMLEAEDVDDATQRRRDAANFYKQAGEAWIQMGEKSKAAEAQVKAAIALNHGDESRLLSKEALAGMEEAIEAHVPDVFNPYARYRQTGHSAFINPDSEETPEEPSAATLELAEQHIVTRAYSHEPLQQLVCVLVEYGEYASALYAAGAATAILEKDGVSTLSLSRAYVTETILTLAMGDPIAAEQQFLRRHVQKTAYLSSRECQLAEDLFRAVKQRDRDALEEARSPSGPNRTALANLDESLRVLVTQIRLSGVARKDAPDTTSSQTKSRTKSGANDEKDEASLPTLKELASKKTGYESEVAQGAALDADALHDELEQLDFDGLDSDDNENNLMGNDEDLDDLEDDDVDLR